MTTHITIPNSSFFFLRSYEINSGFAGFLLKLKMRVFDGYGTLLLTLVGYKNLVLENKIAPDASDLKLLIRLKGWLAFVRDVTEGIQDDEHLKDIHEMSIESIQAIDTVQEIINERNKYNELKKNLYSVSSQAVVSNLKKYKEPVYGN